jgi:hypothetical protein
MSHTTEDDETVIYPVLGWRTALGDDEVCLVEIVFARNLKEAEVSTKGGEAPGVPLGMTAHQCRELGADLIDAANKLDGKKGMS